MVIWLTSLPLNCPRGLWMTPKGASIDYVDQIFELYWSSLHKREHLDNPPKTMWTFEDSPLHPLLRVREFFTNKQFWNLGNNDKQYWISRLILSRDSQCSRLKKMQQNKSYVI